ncbi:Uncharacterised protein [Vibrio cholerae]|nr:Uncharacterised protein [Vibrio cholerae]
MKRKLMRASLNHCKVSKDNLRSQGSIKSFSAQALSTKSMLRWRN